MEGLVMKGWDQLCLELVLKVVAGEMSRVNAEHLLGISERTLRRYLEEYREKGIRFIRHGNSGRKPVNKNDEEIKRYVQHLMKQKYYDFNMEHAREKIKEETGYDVKRETFRSWCHEINMVKKAKKRRSRPRYKRERMPQPGLLVQLDGSHHRWFGERETCLIAAVDDATSLIVGAQFFEGETTQGCFSVLADVVRGYGVFKGLYVDHAGLYGGLKRHGFSQVKRAVEEVGSHVIFANSPQAKGRIERLFGTLQDRMVAEMRLNKIRTIEQANEYIRNVYIPHQYNPRFSVQAHNTQPAWTTMPTHLTPESVFCVKEYRVVGRDHTISFGADRYMINEPLKYSIHNQRIEIRITGEGSWKAYFADRPLRLVKINKEKKAAGSRAA
jgi:transposase